MDRKQIIIVILVIIIIALVALIGGLFFANNAKDDVIIYNNTIEGVGTFNTTNVTNFTLNESYDDGATHYSAQEGDGTQIIVTGSSALIENTKSEAEKVNDSSEGHTIYKNTANVGEFKGDVRYFSVLVDNDNQRYVYMSSPDFNLTSMMVDSFKMF